MVERRWWDTPAWHLPLSFISACLAHPGVHHCPHENFSTFICAQSPSHYPTLVTSWMVTLQAPLSVEIFRQEYWSRWPFPAPGNLPNPGIKPVSPASLALTGRFFTTEPPRKLNFLHNPFKAGFYSTTLVRGYFEVEWLVGASSEEEFCGNIWAPDYQTLGKCREPAQEIPPMTRSCGGELIGKADQNLGDSPGPARASTPKPKSICLLFTILCFSPTPLTLTGGYPQPPFSEENQLRAS